ncbi:hypothetical protein ACQKMN_16955 [Ureibacillus composti]
MELIEVVQNEIHKQSGKTYKEFLEEKHSAFEKGWTIENERVVFWHSPTVKLADNPLRSPAKYVWEVVNGEVKPFNGRALELAK